MRTSQLFSDRQSRLAIIFMIVLLAVATLLIIAVQRGGASVHDRSSDKDREQTISTQANGREHGPI